MKATFSFSLLIGFAAFLSETALLLGHHETLASEKRDIREISLNGVKFRIPKGYVRIPENEVANSVFLFSKKYKEGFFVSLPSATFDEVQLLNRNTEVALSKFFPVGPHGYAWKQLTDRRRVSKFEIGASKTMGFNKRNLIIVQVHHFRVNGRELFIGDLFEWTNGNAEEIFAEGLGGESMQGCNDLVEIVYSITGEKIDETNSPCELIALVPDDWQEKKRPR